MHRLTTCIAVEYKKLFHSKIPLISLLAVSLVPFVGGMFMFVLKDPEMAQRLGLISAQAQLVGVATADWSSYFHLLAMAISIGGLMIFGFVFSWVFGREYSDRTIKDLLALPVARDTIVVAKLSVASLWCLVISMYAFILALLAGKLVNMPGWFDTVCQGSLIFFVCSLLTIFLSAPMAFLASVGRGYLFPIGFMIFTIALAQLATVIGYGQFFPWAIPALLSEVVIGEPMLRPVSIVSVLVTSGCGVAGTILWWKNAEQQ